jgi:Holliday junction resolvase
MDRSAAHTDLCRLVRQYLEYQGFGVWKLWGGPMGDGGMPDFMAIKAGVAVFIEVKTGRAQLQADQVKQRDKLLRAGALYLECRSVDQLEDYLVDAKLCQPALMRFGT